MQPTLHTNHLHLIRTGASLSAARLNRQRLSSLLDALDELHSAVSEGELRAATTLTESELRSWLSEIIYTAQETLREMDNGHGGQTPKLHVVRRSS